MIINRAFLSYKNSFIINIQFDTIKKNKYCDFVKRYIIAIF